MLLEDECWWVSEALTGQCFEWVSVEMKGAKAQGRGLSYRCLTLVQVRPALVWWYIRHLISGGTEMHVCIIHKS